MTEIVTINGEAFELVRKCIAKDFEKIKHNDEANWLNVHVFDYLLRDTDILYAVKDEYGNKMVVPADSLGVHLND